MTLPPVLERLLARIKRGKERVEIETYRKAWSGTAEDANAKPLQPPEPGGSVLRLLDDEEKPPS